MNENKKNKNYDFLPESYTPLKRGIDFQREVFKQARLGSDYDSMVKSIENIKSEIKYKAIHKHNSDKILRIEKIVEWYYKLPQAYTVRTEEGMETTYPFDIERKINRNLNIAYEILIDLLRIVGLI